MVSSAAITRALPLLLLGKCVKSSAFADTEQVIERALLDNRALADHRNPEGSGVKEWEVLGSG